MPQDPPRSVSRFHRSKKAGAATGRKSFGDRTFMKAGLTVHFGT
jgi:hypothetical protein